MYLLVAMFTDNSDFLIGEQADMVSDLDMSNRTVPGGRLLATASEVKNRRTGLNHLHDLEDSAKDNNQLEEV